MTFGGPFYNFTRSRKNGDSMSSVSCLFLIARSPTTQWSTLCYAICALYSCFEEETVKCPAFLVFNVTGHDKPNKQGWETLERKAWLCAKLCFTCKLRYRCSHSMTWQLLLGIFVIAMNFISILILTPRNFLQRYHQVELSFKECYRDHANNDNERKQL